MGTPEFAVSSLRSLYEGGFDIKAVVTQPDRERGRGRKVSFTPVKQAALEMGIPVLQPYKMRDASFIEALKGYGAELFVVVAFRILPKEILEIPPLGSVNLHASLLPEYRGAAPINHALFNGEKETGVTVFFLNRGVDTGNIVSSEAVAVDDCDDYGSLYEKLAVTGAGLLSKTTDDIFCGSFSTFPQPEGEFKPAPKIGPEDCIIDWTAAAENICNRIRGLSPRPGACTFLEGRRIKILKAVWESGEKNTRPGTVTEADCRKNHIRVSAGSGSVLIKTIQAEGKPAMEAGCFLNGNPVVPGSRFS